MNKSHDTHPSAGRPSLFKEETQDVSIRLPVSLLEWIEAESHEDVPRSATMRKMLIAQAKEQGYK